MTNVCKAFDSSILIYKDECEMWLKSPEFDLQICTDDLESGMDLLEEQIDYAIRTSEPSDVEIPEAFEWIFRRVGKEEYGPTLADFAEEDEFEGEYLLESNVLLLTEDAAHPSVAEPGETEAGSAGKQPAEG